MIVMDKVLLVGQSNRVNNEIYQQLSTAFEVHFCRISDSAIEQCLNKFSPRLIVFSMTGFVDDCIPTLKYLLREHDCIPILGVCDENQQYLSAKNLNAQQCKIILRPDSREEFIDHCNSMFDEQSDDKEQQTVQQTVTISSSQSDDNRPHILVVDDNAMVLRTTRLMLKEKYSVSIASSGAQALMAIDKRIPDIILLDYKMPVLDGEKTMKILKDNDDVKNIPVIFFTSADDPDTVKRLISLRPAGYILKPPDKQKLIGMIEKTLAGGE